MKILSRFVLSLVALFGTAIIISSCGGGSSSSSTNNPPPPSQAATPTASPAAGAYAAAQSVTLSSVTSGATIYYTTDGSTPTAASTKYTAPINVSTSMTIQAIATASNFSNSSVASFAYTINIPQSVSWKVSNLSLNLFGTMTIDSSLLDASTSCPPSSVTISVNPTSTYTQYAAGAIVAKWSSDPSGKTFGTIGGPPNTIQPDSTNTYNVTAVCGSSSATVPLSVNVLSPTISAVSCSPSQSNSACVVQSTGTYTFSLTGGNFMAFNAPMNNPNPEWGTRAHSQLADSQHPSCPTNPDPSQAGASITWIDQNHGTQSVSGTMNPGSWYYMVRNFPAADGAGGGYACLNNAFTVVANGTTGGFANGGTAQLVNTSTLNLFGSNGALQHSVSLPKGSASLRVINNDQVWVSNPEHNLIFVVDIKGAIVRTVDTGMYSPVFVANDSNDSIYIAAREAGDGSHGAILRLESDGSLTKLADADGFGALLVTRDNRLVWTAGTYIHVLDPSSGSEQTMDAGNSVDQLTQLSGGALAAWMTGEKNVYLFDLAKYRQVGEVATPDAVWTRNGDYLSLADGSIGKLSAVGFQVVAKTEAKLYNGFAVVVDSKGANPAAVIIDANAKAAKQISLANK